MNEKTRNYFTVYLVLVISYLLFRLPDLIAVTSFPCLSWPLNSLYIANKLLFVNNVLNPGLASTITSPSNETFIMTPGSYIIAKAIGKVSHMFLFLFVLQSIVPIAIFRLFRSVSSVSISTVATLFITYYCTDMTWWASDWIIQPMMLIAVIIMLESLDDLENMLNPLIVGLLAGVIMVFKQNIGLFFGVLCITVFFMKSLVIGRKIGSPASGISKLLFWFHIAGYFGFGLLFLTRVLYADEAVFFLFPYFLFWGAIAYYALRRGAAVVAEAVYIKRVFLFMASFLVLPLCIFLWMGSTIGYAKYWGSLFGMGFKYLHIWDYGILGFIGKGFQSWKPLTLINALRLYYSPLMIASMILFAFVVNVAAAIKVIAIVKDDAGMDENTTSFLSIASMGIIGVFMFFPLEGFHILITKFFIFCFIFFHMAQAFSVKKTAFLKKILIILTATVFFFDTSRLVKAYNTEIAYGSEEIQSTIGARLDKDIAAELGAQIKVIKRSVRGDRFYTVSSAGTALTALDALVDNGVPQYYIEMRKGILSREVNGEILSMLGGLPFAVVRSEDYAEYLKGKQADPHMHQILDFLHRNYDIVDSYVPPAEKKQSTSQIDGFLVMKNRRT